MRRMSTEERARDVGMVQAGRSLREVCISWLHRLFLITIFTLTVLKINKAYFKSLRLLQVARDFNRDHKTISRLVRKFQRTGSVEDLPRTPKRRVTTRQQDRYIRLTHLRDRNLTARTTVHTQHSWKAWEATQWPNYTQPTERGWFTCKTTLCRISIVSQAQTTSVSLGQTSSEVHACRLGSGSFYRRV